MDEFVRAGSVAEIPEGELRAFELPFGRVCLANSGGEMFAVGDECTHQGCSLAEDGELKDDEVIECVCHGSLFDLASGEPTRGPAMDRLPVFQVRVTDGWVEVGPSVEE